MLLEHFGATVCIILLRLKASLKSMEVGLTIHFDLKKKLTAIERTKIWNHHTF